MMGSFPPLSPIWEYLNGDLPAPLPQAKWTIEHEIHSDTEISDLPAFANNRFGIRQELAFELCVTWVAAMTYVSIVRLNDPQYEANLLLQHTYQLNDRVYRAFVIASGVTYGSISQLMRYCWHTEGFCNPFQRDRTIDVYEKYICLIQDLTDESLEGTLKELKSVFGNEKAGRLDSFWKLHGRKRSIVFGQARSPEFQPYVTVFLETAAEPTRADIHKRKRAIPDATCLKEGPIHNCKTEHLFAHSSHAEQSTQAGHNRLRGLAISKASATFQLESKLRSNRRKRFLNDVKRSRAKLEDWVENHKSDEGFLGLFNTKRISVQRRREIIRQALSGSRDNVSESRCACHPRTTQPRVLPIKIRAIITSTGA